MLDKPSHRPDASVAVQAAPLLMLPGTLCDGRVFGAVLDRLDLPAAIPALSGSGKVAELADRIIATMPERVSLLGFSLGAVVALEIIARAPQRVERLALIACNPGVLSPEARAIRRAARRDSFVAAGEPTLAHEMATAASDADWHDQTSITLGRTDSRPRLAAIAVPTLALCGAGDRICPPDTSRYIATAIAGARLAIIADAGHYVTLEQPDRVADEINAWLATPSHLN